MKRISARAIIIDKNQVFTIYRRKIIDGKIKEYYVLPGGGIEDDEAKEEAVIRELKEEFNVNINLLGYIGKHEKSDTIAHFFHAEIGNQTPILSGEEKIRNNENNYYEIRKININDLDNIDIDAKELIKNAFNKIYIK